jgi:hypothetical protein
MVQPFDSGSVGRSKSNCIQMAQEQLLCMETTYWLGRQITGIIPHYG